jgi:hypothetical protein
MFKEPTTTTPDFGPARDARPGAEEGTASNRFAGASGAVAGVAALRAAGAAFTGGVRRDAWDPAFFAISVRLLLPAPPS